MRLSILINNFNYEAYLGQAIESALRQTHDDVEVIVVDDGSQDRSLEVMERYRNRVRIIAKGNGGQASAYNAGFAACSGELVIFLDADDWLFAGAAQQIVAAYRPGVSKLQFALMLVDRDGRFLGRQIPYEMSDRHALAQLQAFGAYNSPPGSGNVYFAPSLRAFMPIDEDRWRSAADTVPISLAPLLGDIVSLPHALGAYRLHRRDASGLLLNNAPVDLWDEYGRIEITKSLVAAAMSALGIAPNGMIMLAPWEARIAVLCARFAPDSDHPGTRSRPQIFRHALKSLWLWPTWRWKRKMLQSAWMILVYWLPMPLARRLAQQHRAAGAAVSQAEPPLQRA